MIRVAIIGGSAVLRAGLASVIGAEPDVQIVATSEHRDADSAAGNDLLATRSSQLDVDVVILVPQRTTSFDDVLASDGSNLDERFRGPATMVLLERVESSAALDAYTAGASAVLAIDASAEELRSALRAIAAGLVVVSAGVSAELLAGPRRVPTAANSTRASALTPLTSREREVLALLAQGLANKVIASRLGITEHTVKTHVAAVYEKLNARNRAEVLVAAARQGLVLL